METVGAARLALAYEACQLAEAARVAVPIAAEELTDGARATAAAGEVLRAAGRYFAALDAYTAAVSGRRPARSAAGDWWRRHLLDEPSEAAEDLDDWVRRHADEDPGPAPVSGPLGL